IAGASVRRSLASASSTSGPIASYVTPAASSIWRRIGLVEARIRVKRTTLWKRTAQALARPWGRAQRPHHSTAAANAPRIHPRGWNPPPACESRVELGATRGPPESSASRALLANPGRAPKPRSPVANHIINLFKNLNIKEIKEVARSPEAQAAKPLIAVLRGE